MEQLLEIELKCYCDVAPDIIEERIKSVGAEFVETRQEHDIYFNHPSRDFKSTDEALRLRKIGDRYRITYKGPKISDVTKARVEQETSVGNFDTMKNILLSLGFVESGVVIKLRKIFSAGDTEISIDMVDGLGLFVEIEKVGVLKEHIEKEILDIAQKLGLSRFERKSYLELKYFS
ncbi:MAG: class IV adenylate cyclase [Spirochaetes bacterium]|jgi:adenylate cyclase class 2|nr:class IV adenylate cyclase [Spirochaetota bacterium]